jgi:hypothetical protein
MQTDVREVSGWFHVHTSRVVGSLEVVRAGDEGRWRASLPLKEGRRLQAPTRSNFEFSKNLQRAVTEGTSFSVNRSVNRLAEQALRNQWIKSLT